MSTQPVAEDKECLRMKRLEVLEELGRKKEKLLEEDRHSSGVKSGERQVLCVVCVSLVRGV